MLKYVVPPNSCSTRLQKKEKVLDKISCRRDSVPCQPLPFTKSMAWVDQFSNIWFVVSPTYLRIYFLCMLCVFEVRLLSVSPTLLSIVLRHF